MGPTTAIIENLEYMDDVEQIRELALQGNAEAMLQLGIEYVHIIIDIRRDEEISSKLRKYHEYIDDMGTMMVYAIYWLEHAIASKDLDVKRQANYWLGECMFIYKEAAGLSKGYIQYLFDEIKQNDQIMETIKNEKGSFLYRFINDEEFSYTAMLDFYLKAVTMGDTSAAYRLGSHYLQQWMNTRDDKQAFNDAKKYLKAAILPKEEYALADLFDALEKYLIHNKD